jgi:two-component system LytT family response regulator
MSRTLRALIIDDERLARVEMRRLLQAHSSIEIIGEAPGGPEAVAMIGDLHPDLVFLDIQMPGMTGFDVLDQLYEVPQVIFTTAYDQYAIQAFEVNALDYLLKPIAPERLSAALERVKQNESQSTPTPTSAKKLEQVFVRDGERCWIVRIPEIFLLESEGNYTRVCFGTDRPLIRRSLNALEQQLDPDVFFRANRKQIINLKWIKNVDVAVGGGLMVRLQGSTPGRTTEIEMSRRQSERLKEILSL